MKHQTGKAGDADLVFTAVFDVRGYSTIPFSKSRIFAAADDGEVSVGGSLIDDGIERTEHQNRHSHDCQHQRSISQVEHRQQLLHHGKRKAQMQCRGQQGLSLIHI